MFIFQIIFGHFSLRILYEYSIWYYISLINKRGGAGISTKSIAFNFFFFVKNRLCVIQICLTKIAAKCILVVVVKWRHHANVLLSLVFTSKCFSLNTGPDNTDLEATAAHKNMKALQAKVNKLESEVIVLEAAMANLAKRIQAEETKSGKTLQIWLICLLHKCSSYSDLAYAT